MRFRFLPILSIILLTACLGGPSPTGQDGGNGDGTGQDLGGSGQNPATRPTPGFSEFEMRPATSTTLPPPAAFLKGLIIIDQLVELNEIRMVLRDLEFGNGGSFDKPGPFIVRLIFSDAIVDESFPKFGSSQVQQGFYDQSDLGFKLLAPEEIPPELEDDPVVTGPLVDHSIVVEGKFKGPLLNPVLGQWIRFRFVSTQTVDLRIESPTSFELGDPAATLFIAFKVRTWLDESLVEILHDFLEKLDLKALLKILSEGLVLDTKASDPTLRGIALTLESNINASLRFALSPDDIFNESEVDETSLSFVLP